jgi:hypothetical protein
MTTTRSFAVHDDTGEAEERRTVAFDRVVNAAGDLGLRPGDRVDDALEAVAGAGDTLVRFPPGEYLVGSDIAVDADNVGVESTTQNRADVTFRAVEERAPTLFQAQDNPQGFYVGHVTLDRREEWASSLSLLRGNYAGVMYVTGVEMVGYAPESADSIAKFNVRAGGHALVEDVRQADAITYGSYPHGQTIAFFNGYPTEGSVTYRDIDLQGASESGIYAGKAHGPVRVENSFFKNCAHTGVRVTGEHSWIQNTTVVMDVDDLHPESRVTRDDGSDVPKLNRGIWVQSAGHEHAGPLIQNVDVVVENTGNGIAGVFNAGDTGGMRLRDVRVTCDDDDVFPALVQEERPGDAGKPYHVDIDGLSVTGAGSGRPAVEIRGRDGSTIRDACIDFDGGIEHDAGCVVDGLSTDGCAPADASSPVEGDGGERRSTEHR